jgi:hypothetical protein
LIAHPTGQTPHPSASASDPFSNYIKMVKADEIDTITLICQSMESIISNPDTIDQVRSQAQLFTKLVELRPL